MHNVEIITLRTFILLYSLQANHRFTTNLQRRIYGHATNVVIRPLNEEKAVQAAADLVGELFLFTVLSISETPCICGICMTYI